MSSERGNVSRTRPQRHQNARAFKNDKYDTSARCKKINAKLHDGVCQHCKGILEWRVKFRKYKLLTKPKKCCRGPYLLCGSRHSQCFSNETQKSEKPQLGCGAQYSQGRKEAKPPGKSGKHLARKSDVVEQQLATDVKCLQKTVKDPYHIICRPCAGKLEICAKCGKQEEIVIPIDKGQDRTDSETSKNGQESSKLKDELDFDTNFSNADSDEDSDVLEERFKSMNFETTEI